MLLEKIFVLIFLRSKAYYLSVGQICCRFYVKETKIKRLNRSNTKKMIKKNIKKSFLRKRVFTRPSFVKIFFKWKHEPVKVLKYSNYMKIIFTGTRGWKFKNKKTVKNNSFLSKVITSSNCRDCTCNK